VRYKKHEFAPNIYMSTAERFIEFRSAVQWLLDNHSPTHRYLKFLSVRFYKGDAVSPAALGDYGGVKGFDHLDSQIRVAYGKNGKSTDALRILFHEWKHLLQDDAGVEADCSEADAWAADQVPAFRKSRINLVYSATLKAA